MLRGKKRTLVKGHIIAVLARGAIIKISVNDSILSLQAMERYYLLHGGSSSL